ncbi:MAG: hypothetical protein AAGU76_04340 [Sedimentibacter sp.]|uniref:hypothetical protein n=1 Tax=Sedimentibacter sp. TaxID=1960295 RepID=UPI003158297A
MIFTLDARGNVLLPVMVSTLNLNNEQCTKVVLGEFTELKKKLQVKGIEYSKLKSALTPVHKDKKEAAFIFDSSLIENCWYGNVVFKSLLPALNKESTYSILCGDIIADRIPLDISKEIIFENLVQFHSTVFKHPIQYYVIYINNLSDAQLEAIIEALSSQVFFVGYVDMTFSSRLKTILAYSLVHLGIKYQDTMILQHEADREDDENINNCGYDFENYGFSVISINDMYFGLFLSYKIEALFADPEDLKYSMNAIYSNVTSAFELPVSVVEKKLLYLKEKKAAIMEKLGLQDYSTEELAHLIRDCITKSYFYNLEYLEEYNVPKFNISLELKTVEGKLRKVLVALKYSPSNMGLELITMY